jgi:hypothetical protein
MGHLLVLPDGLILRVFRYLEWNDILLARICQDETIWRPIVRKMQMPARIASLGGSSVRLWLSCEQLRHNIINGIVLRTENESVPCRDINKTHIDSHTRYVWPTRDCFRLSAVDRPSERGSARCASQCCWWGAGGHSPPSSAFSEFFAAPGAKNSEARSCANFVRSELTIKMPLHLAGTIYGFRVGPGYIWFKGDIDSYILCPDTSPDLYSLRRTAHLAHAGHMVYTRSPQTGHNATVCGWDISQKISPSYDQNNALWRLPAQKKTVQAMPSTALRPVVSFDRQLSGDTIHRTFRIFLRLFEPL